MVRLCDGRTGGRKERVEVTVTSIFLLAALIVSTIANAALMSRLRAAKKREEAMRNERFW